MHLQFKNYQLIKFVLNLVAREWYRTRKGISPLHCIDKIGMNYFLSSFVLLLYHLLTASSPISLHLKELSFKYKWHRKVH